MTTRRASASRPLAQERYMSSPEYAELRGIAGSAVTAKAAIVDDESERSLLFFLQALSLKAGGLKKFCADFLAMFPERIGSPSMHANQPNAEGNFPPEIARAIQDELYPVEKAERGRRRRLIRDAKRANRLLALQDGESVEALATDQENQYNEEPPEHSSLEYFIGACRSLASGLDQTVIELCVNPDVRLHNCDDGRWFADLPGALLEYQRRYADSLSGQFAMTGIAREVFATLEVLSRTGRRDKTMVLIEGEPGLGKTSAAEAWVNQHLGEARFISLSGVTTKTGVFRAICKALGLAASNARTSTEMQTRAENVLQKSGLILVIDEAHFLFSGSERLYSRPELIDWLDTSLYNHGVPVGLVCTPQFRVRLNRAERQTGWNGAQFKRRVQRFKTLPPRPSIADVELVARKLLPASPDNAIQFIAGYALSSALKMPMPSLAHAVDEARRICVSDVRTVVTFEDCERAINDFCLPTAAAWTTPPPSTSRPRLSASSPGQTTSAPAASPRKTNLTGMSPGLRVPERPVETEAGNRLAAPMSRIKRGEPAEA